MFGLWNNSPMAQNIKFSQFELHTFAQNFPTCTSYNSINCYILRVILDFLEIPRCTLQSLCWSFLHLKNLSWCKLPWQKVSFCWLLKWPIMYGLISFKWSTFWTWEYIYKVVENWISFKMGFGWGKVDEACESYAWSKFSWLLLRKP